MAGVAEPQNRQARPMPPLQSRGPPPPARPRSEPVDREKICFGSFCSYSWKLTCTMEREQIQMLKIHPHCRKTCPLLLRVFTKVGGHHPQEDFAVRGKEPKDEVQIYTWKDATLRELTDLVKEVAPAARRRDAKLSFAFVYPDKNGHFVVRPVGMTHSHGNGRRMDDHQTLADLSFQIGDYLSVAII